MKPWLVDVPVRVNIWIRPECQKKQFAVLKEARPSILFLISDGGRNEKEWEDIRENRRLVEEGIDWECTVYKIYEEKNNGLYAMGKKANDLIWSKVDRCIFLEDDQIPSVSYFAFCAELLEKYKDDERIEAISGMNHCGTLEAPTADYFFSMQGSIWGMASWKRCYEHRDPEHTYAQDSYVMNMLKQHTKKDGAFWKAVKGYAENTKYGNHVAGGEYYHRFELYGQHRLFIVPKYNLVSNIGCTADSTHATNYQLMPRGVRQVFDTKTYELPFPLTHPRYVIADLDYAKKSARIMGFGHPLVRVGRRIESVLLTMRYKGLSGLWEKAKKKSAKRGKVES